MLFPRSANDENSAHKQMLGLYFHLNQSRGLDPETVFNTLRLNKWKTEE